MREKNRYAHNPSGNSGYRWIIGLSALILLTGMAIMASGVWIKAKAVLSQVLLERAFEQSLASHAANAPMAATTAPTQLANRINTKDPTSTVNSFKPWAWADISPLARIKAPHLNAEAIVLSDVSSEALAFGPGHVNGTPLPGEMGTAVISAHRDTHFAWLKDLKPGDKVEVSGADGTTRTFRMTRAWIARFDQSGIDTDSHGRKLALTTCWPFDAKTRGPLRYIVETELVRTTSAQRSR